MKNLRSDPNRFVVPVLLVLLLPAVGVNLGIMTAGFVVLMFGLHLAVVWDCLDESREMAGVVLCTTPSKKETRV